MIFSTLLVCAGMSQQPCKADVAKEAHELGTFLTVGQFQMAGMMAAPFFSKAGHSFTVVCGPTYVELGVGI